MAVDAGTASYGGFTLDGMALALPMAALREVLPCGTLSSLPCALPSVVGGIELRGAMVPVLDLRRVLGRDGTPPPQPCVIVMMHGGRLLGLRVDAVTGVFGVADDGQPAAAARVTTATPEDDAALPLYVCSLRRTDTGTMVSLLSPAALAALGRSAMVDDPDALRAAAGDDQSATGRGAALPRAMPLLLVRCGRTALALDALAVHATLSDPVIAPSALGMGLCLGVTAYAGVRIPVVDLLSLCGLGALAPGGRRQAFVLKLEGGFVGLLVDEVLDVSSARLQDVVPVPAFALREHGLFAGALPTSALPSEARLPGGLNLHYGLLLNARALQTCDTLTALSQTNTPAADVGAAGAAGTPPPGTAALSAGGEPLREMITYELFGEEATPIDQVAEILRYDPSDEALVAHGRLIGLMVHRGRSIPVICLRRMAGLPAAELGELASVLVVRSADDWVGFVVPRLRAIEAVSWSPALPPGGMAAHDALAQSLQSRELALIRSGGRERMLRVLNLQAIADGLRDEHALAA